MSEHGSKNPPSGNSENVNISQDGRPALRRPMPDTQQRLLNGSPGTGNQQVSPKKPAKQLSVNAPEFVPKFTIPPPPLTVPKPQAGQGDGLMKPNLSVTAAEFVPRGQPAYTHVQNNLFEDFQRLVSITPSHVSAPASKPTSDKVISDFKTMLFNMTIQPGNIEEYLSSIVNIMKNVADETVVREVIEILFEQCVTEPNFRYTGARVCRHMTKELKHVRAFANFRTQFLTRCKEDYLKKDDWALSADTIPRLCGFTMFIGELFLNLEVDNPDGTSQKVGVLRFVLRDLLLALLSNPNDTTVKSVTQLLKLTGSTIEDTAHLNANPEERDYSKVFQQLQQLNMSQDLNQTSHLLIKSVLNLKENNWGRESTSSTSSQPDSHSQSYSQGFSTNEPVFYNQQGQTITREEAGYYDDYTDYMLEQEAEAYAYMQAGDTGYQSNYGNNISSYNRTQSLNHNGNGYHQQNPSDYQAWSSNPDDVAYEEDYNYSNMVNYDENYMDDEMEAAYEEFLRSQNQGHR
ncbi:polyadenylate-binding protein-interacting protein 1-like isoform X1 [Pecten maximus]|uniref:polyadenylate-binding protein-interacting protein 1-like isoform X1 n=1 Tax=Pecten maximus TaxID=6579 RepID=UPI001458104F|nr:polyadenylate-binding protein-interacting protein 1-like isoform X1 [Pecten maximus]